MGDCSKACQYIKDPIPTKIGEMKSRRWFRTIYEVYSIKGGCPVYKKGDKIVFDDDKINPNESNFICCLALPSFSMRYCWIRGSEEASRSAGEEPDMYVSCAAPGPPFTTYGRVVFQAHRVPMEDER